MTISVSTDVFWFLPGPRDFISELATTLTKNRAVALRVPSSSFAATWHGVQEALARAHLSSERTVRLDIRDGTHLESEIGEHFGRTSLAPSELAALPDMPATVVLWPKSEIAATKCSTYLKAFHLATEYEIGSSRLLVRFAHDISGALAGSAVATTRFDGALTVDEMSAYVGMRMVGRGGPGSTKLLAALVREFAGYDAGFAELLMTLSDAAIIGLPATLTDIVSEDTVRWRSDSWQEGTSADIDGRHVLHTLHEWHLASHPGPRQDQAAIGAAKRYWRASVQSIIPWLEERRAHVLKVLDAPLRAYAATTGGMIERPLPNQQVQRTPVEELEYNNIVGLARYGLQVPDDQRSRLAVKVCRLAKIVRDDLAHLRAPAPVALLDLISSMDQLLGASMSG